MSVDPVDFMGNPIKVGSKIVYATAYGSGGKLTYGQVLAIGQPANQYSHYKISIKVQPLQDSRGRRWSNLEFDVTEKKYKEVGLPRPVILHFTDRLLVLE